MTTTSSPTQKKSGFVVLMGRSNVGKSTLLNALVGSKIAITSPKPQTTRLPIHGILTTEQGQAVFVDTPGMMHKKRDGLTDTLGKTVKEALSDVNLVLYVADPTRAIAEEEKATLRLLEPLSVPKFLVINKTDLTRVPFLDFYRDLSDRFTRVYEISAIRGNGIGDLIRGLFEVLPEGEFFYPEGQITNISNETWIAELIREKLFLRLREEVPYSTHVEVEEVARRDNGTLYIQATIFTSAERYKSMIIGAGGRGVREIGQSTRHELEAVMPDTQVYLDLRVHVDPHWVERLRSVR